MPPSHAPFELDVEDADSKSHPGRRMTEAEFEEWVDDNTKAEWVDGEVIVVSDNAFHDQLLKLLTKVIGIFSDLRYPGKIMGPMFTVRLPNIRRRRKPDLLFVSDARSQIVRATFVEGAPELAVEIVSDDSRERDSIEKRAEYAKAGVREYWIIDPIERRFTALSLGQENVYNAIPMAAGRIHSVVIPGFFIRPEWLWHDPIPSDLSVNILRELGVL